MITGFIVTEAEADSINGWFAEQHSRNGDPNYWQPGKYEIFTGRDAGKFFVPWNAESKAVRLKELNTKVRTRMSNELKIDDGTGEKGEDISLKSEITVNDLAAAAERKFAGFSTASVNEKDLVDPNAGL